MEGFILGYYRIFCTYYSSFCERQTEQRRYLLHEFLFGLAVHRLGNCLDMGSQR